MNFKSLQVLSWGLSSNSIFLGRDWNLTFEWKIRSFWADSYDCPLFWLLCPQIRLPHKTLKNISKSEKVIIFKIPMLHRLCNIDYLGFITFWKFRPIQKHCERLIFMTFRLRLFVQEAQMRKNSEKVSRRVILPKFRIFIFDFCFIATLRLLQHVQVICSTEKQDFRKRTQMHVNSGYSARKYQSAKKRSI